MCTIELYNIKWLCKINVYALHRTRIPIIFDYTNPFFGVIKIYTAWA